MGLYGSTSIKKMGWAHLTQSPEPELAPYDIDETFRKYFPLAFYRLENFIHRNLVMQERTKLKKSAIRPKDFYLDTLPQELQEKARAVLGKLNRSILDFFIYHVSYDEPKTRFEENLARKSPEESLFIVLEFLKYFSYPSPYSVIRLNSRLTRNLNYDSMPTHQPFVKLLIQNGLLNLRPQMSVIIHAEALGHLVFGREFETRYNRLSTWQKIKFRLRKPVLISGHGDFMRYINRINDEQFDRRIVTQNKYGLRVERFAGEKQPYKALDDLAKLISKGKFKQYSNFSFKYKDNHENLKN